MTDESDSDPTRRAYLTTAAALVGGGSLAGCTGGEATDTPADGSGDTATPTETPTDTPTPTGGAGTQTETPASTESSAVETSYSVSIEPVGEVTFDAVPETWVANNGSWADMGIALGLEPPEGVWLKSRYHTDYYDSIPGVSVDKSDVVSLYQDGGVGTELFYELDADVHVMDPNFLMNRFKGWEQSDVDEIVSEIGPIFGNCIYAQHYPWHSDYRYYTLMEGFEKLAQVFDRTDRYEAFEAVHDEFQSNLAPVVPNQGDRPEVAVLWGVGNEPEEYYPYVVGEGTGFKHLTDLRVRDALASTDIKDFHGSRAAIDLETLLKVDPEVMMLRGYEAMSADEFQNTVVSFLEDHQTAGTLTAVRNGDVYRAGGLYQGPITSMVLTERTANQLYGADAELFDRERVAAIVAGDL
ncbi:ABC transporter substrate-binding protein [Halosimplex litoreum]|uniref:ABC transporter substrate-binding protein n=1 Tax=Halosimplex litoreum TaxID=1198301 RepID=A0A7T3G0U7_9EURY|nr:ABC transporter substrate-binding protein [Halosimplex litoreum]QPV64295.1 ABC transporter substrate-binding protein [Halosimplex litoreum]